MEKNKKYEECDTINPECGGKNKGWHWRQPHKEVFYGVVPKSRNYSIFLVIQPYTSADFLGFYLLYPRSLFHQEYQSFQRQ